jgi:molybdenum cofactor cytidylyltransferase
MTATDLPVVDPPTADVDAVRDGSVAGVLLAAGTSSRFGEENKLLARVDGDPLVRRAGRTLAAAGVEPRVAVLGHEADRVAGALDGLGFRFVRNPDYAAGQATSVGAGVDAVSGASAAVFALGDMPAVDPATVGALVAAYRAGAGTALAAAFDGRRGNPVLFDARHFDALADVAGDVGGREILLDGDESALVETGDPGVCRDVDTPADL